MATIKITVVKDDGSTDSEAAITIATPGDPVIEQLVKSVLPPAPKAPGGAPVPAAGPSPTAASVLKRYLLPRVQALASSSPSADIQAAQKLYTDLVAAQKARVS